MICCFPFINGYRQFLRFQIHGKQNIRLIVSCLRYKREPLTRQIIKQMNIITIKVAHSDSLLSLWNCTHITGVTQAPVLTGAYDDRIMCHVTPFTPEQANHLVCHPLKYDSL